MYTLFCVKWENIITNMGHRVTQGTITIDFLSAFPNEQTDGMLKG